MYCWFLMQSTTAQEHTCESANRRKPLQKQRLQTTEMITYQIFCLSWYIFVCLEVCIVWRKSFCIARRRWVDVRHFGFGHADNLNVTCCTQAFEVQKRANYESFSMTGRGQARGLFSWRWGTPGGNQEGEVTS